MCVYIYVYVLYIIWKHSNACLVYDLIFCRLRQASNALSKGPETREESAQLEVESMGAPTSTGAVASMHTKHGGGHKRKAVFGLLLIVATTIIMIMCIMIVMMVIDTAGTITIVIVTVIRVRRIKHIVSINIMVLILMGL